MPGEAPVSLPAWGLPVIQTGRALPGDPKLAPHVGGRTRGLGPKYPWSLGFAKDIDTYRSRARAKQRRDEEVGDWSRQLLARLDNQQRQIDELKLSRGDHSADPALDTTVVLTERRSSVADSELPAGDAQVIDGGPGYPVDGIMEQIPCELHQKMKNLSMPVALGYALPDRKSVV